jgi:hypothetical protein
MNPEKRKLTLSEIMARPMPERTPEQDAELAELEALFSPENQKQKSTSYPNDEKAIA